MTKPILSVDFDGVIHSYTSGWQGATVIPDPPVPGALVFLREAVNHFRVCIFSSRSHEKGGVPAMQLWLWNNIQMCEKLVKVESSREDHWYTEIEWPKIKPPAFLTLDDRAITFDGTWPSIESLKEFKPWNKG